jgi:replicative DNA helicase
MGKSGIALNIAQNAAVTQAKKVAIFSLEMDEKSLAHRALAAESRVNTGRARKQGRSSIQDHEYSQLASAAGILNKAPIFVDATPAISVAQIRARCLRHKASHGLDLVIVDYLQLMSAPAAENRNQEVTTISRGLKALAKELDVPVIALSQLSRAVESRPSKIPQLSDLRDSGSLEQDADLILFLYRPEYYFGPVDKDGKSLDGVAQLIVAKQRNGETGTVVLHFRKDLTLFESVTHRQERP